MCADDRRILDGNTARFKDGGGPRIIATVRKVHGGDYGFAAARKLQNRAVRALAGTRSGCDRARATTLSHEDPAGVVVSPLFLPPTRRTHCPCVGFFGGQHDDAASAHAAGLAYDSASTKDAENASFGDTRKRSFVWRNTASTIWSYAHVTIRLRKEGTVSHKISVEDLNALNTLVQDGLIEVAWIENGIPSYRLAKRFTAAAGVQLRRRRRNCR